MLQGKLISSNSNLNLLGMVMMSNALALLPMSLGMYIGNEQTPQYMSWISILAVVSSCVVGTGISFTGWWCRQKISATTYSIVGNMNKILTILANMLIWKHHATTWGIVALCISLTGGAVYDLPVHFFLKKNPQNFSIGIAIALSNGAVCITLSQMMRMHESCGVLKLSGNYEPCGNMTLQFANREIFAIHDFGRIPDKNNTTETVHIPQNSNGGQNISLSLGSVVLLAPRKDSVSFGCTRFCLLLHAVQSVDMRLNMQWGPYPIFILMANDSCLDMSTLATQKNCSADNHVHYTQKDKELIALWAPHSTVSFVSIEMYSGAALEHGLDIKQFNRWNLNLDGGIGGRSIGYRAMCRLYSGRLQNSEFLRGFKYYMRIDDDSFFTSDLKFDPFKEMNSKKLQYAYRRKAHDKWGNVRMWELASPYMNAVSLQNMRQMGLISTNAYTGAQPYNNFHVASVKMFQHREWAMYMRDVERSFGFFKYRFGDANIHAIAMGMLLQPKEVAVWGDLPYSHNVNDMQGYPSKLWKTECMSNTEVLFNISIGGT